MFIIRSLLHGELLLQISVQVLIEPVAHVLQSFLRTRDSGCIIVAVSYSHPCATPGKILKKWSICSAKRNIEDMMILWNILTWTMNAHMIQKGNFFLEL
jgi:hypothetical protein